MSAPKLYVYDPDGTPPYPHRRALPADILRAAADALERESPGGWVVSRDSMLRIADRLEAIAKETK